VPTYKRVQRERAIQRGMEFIYSFARDPQNFAECGDNLLYFFKLVASTSRDENLRKVARKMGKERLRHWAHDRHSLPPNADADTIIEYYHEDSTAEMFDVGNKMLKQQILEAAKRFSATDFLWFDPLSEPPATDVPQDCFCGTWNERGRKTCRDRKCRAPLTMMTRYEVWYYSLTRAYCAENYGVILGARYADVFKWLPTLRPYSGRENDANPDFSDAVYAISHLVYTLNDYGVYNLSPRWLPQEYEFLKANLEEAIALEDSDMMGEFLDSLMAFGLTDSHRLIRKGLSFLLVQQNPDGSWGDMEAEDLYCRYHPTWAAIDGLREYAWRGEGLRFPKLLSLLKLWARDRNGT
jgi:hypothetical protein